MFESLSEKLGDVFERLKKRGALSEEDVGAALREIRVALLEADVALPVVKDFIEGVRARAIGQEVLRSVTPGQMVVKIVHDHLIAMLGGGDVPAEINVAGIPPVAILMVGLQGSGKTTTSAKLAMRLAKRDKKRVLMASLDVYRPAAQQQLKVLGEQAQVPVLQAVLGEQPLAITRRAMETGRREGYDVVVLDTAGRLHIDEALMAEVQMVRDIARPTETLLVADALTGQDAVNLAREFHQKVGITGLVLTRVDGDARGGAALSMRAVTGQPIKLMGVGEKLDALEAFDARRIAGRILGMGDVVGLVEKAGEAMDQAAAEKAAAKMMKGEFTLEDLGEQLGQLRKMGDMQGILGMLPGVGKLKKQMAGANVDDRMLARQQAIIQSMTPKERRNPKLLNGSRRRRIAAGAGTTVQEVNRLLKQHLQMSTMMKKMGKLGKKGFLRGGGLPPGMMPPGFPGR
ncbi:signal recognition particle protein [Shumkonia mesophila]|uniref:signal recognition particle protein n=1 Tax=Shumkonia mesophila TaxID=2838854 RepID=UPI0029346EB0|nr:signal recognition particle protein [Shumkonia mesophila]